MSIPCAHGFAPESTLQSRISTLLRRTWMPSSCAPRDEDAVEQDVARLVDLDAVLASDDGDVADRHVARADDDAAADDGAGRADERLALVDHERPAMDSRGEVHDGRLHRVRRAGGAGRERRRRRRPSTAPARPSSPPSCAYVSRASGRTACPSSCAASQPAANSATAGHERRVDAERARGAHRRGRARARRAEARASPAGSPARGGTRGRRARGRSPVINAAICDAATTRAPPPQARRASASVNSTGASRDSIRPLSVYDIAPPVSGSRAPRTSRRRACLRRGTPTARGRRRARACASRR